MSTERIFDEDALRLRPSGLDVAWVSDRDGAELPDVQMIEDLPYNGGRLRAGRARRPSLIERFVAGPPPGVIAVAFASSALLSLAIEFATHLRSIRNQTAAVLVTSRAATDTAGRVALPHLVAVRSVPPAKVEPHEDSDASRIASRDVHDVVLWELLTLRGLSTLGIEIGAVSHWRDRLDDALLLRARYRAGLLGPAAAAAVADRYLSFKFICEHDTLMRAELLAGHERS